MEQTAVFEFFVRRLPERRSFLVAAGLEQVLEYLQNVRFSPEEIAWLASTRRLSASCLERLASLRFSGILQSPVKVSHRRQQLATEVTQIPH